MRPKLVTVATICSCALVVGCANQGTFNLSRSFHQSKGSISISFDCSAGSGVEIVRYSSSAIRMSANGGDSAAVEYPFFEFGVWIVNNSLDTIRVPNPMFLGLQDSGLIDLNLMLGVADLPIRPGLGPAVETEIEPCDIRSFSVLPGGDSIWFGPFRCYISDICVEEYCKFDASVEYYGFCWEGDLPPVWIGSTVSSTTSIEVYP